MKDLIRTLAGLLMTGGMVAGCQADDAAGPVRTLEGRLSVIIIDNFDEGTASKEYRLEKAGSEGSVALALVDEVKASNHWTTGMRVRVEGAYVSGKDGGDTRRFRVESMERLGE
jgi:hypothetical protein